jgi:hypothetical protein
MSLAIASVVEGPSEVESIPILLRRLLVKFGAAQIKPVRPFRVKRNRVVREGELERTLQQVVLDRENVGCILVILDADDDCPAQLGPSLLERCRQATKLPVAVILATRELEAWFLGAKESLVGIRDIRADAVAPDEPERVRGAKERLSQNMRGGRRYLEVDDQAALAERMDLEMACQRCPSFDKFVRDVGRLVAAVREA